MTRISYQESRNMKGWYEANEYGKEQMARGVARALRHLAYFRDGKRCWCEPGWTGENHQGQCVAAQEALERMEG